MAAKKKYAYKYPRPQVAVDGALFRLHDERLELLLIQRANPPYAGGWALPGGFVEIDEPLENAMAREIAEETGVKNIPFLVQVGAYGNPGRDPRGRVISVAYAGIVAGRNTQPDAGDDAAEALWFPIESLPPRLAFDHPAVIGDALRKIATLGRTSGALFVFLGDRFTRDGVATLLKALYGVPLDPREYLATFIEMGAVRETRTPGKYRFIPGERVRRTSKRSRKAAEKKTAKKKPAKKKSAKRKPVAKKAAAKKSTKNKAASRKTAKKTSAKKSSPKKVAKKRPSKKKSVAKKKPKKTVKKRKK